MLVPRVAEPWLALCLWEPGGIFSTPRQVLPIAKTDHQVIIWENEAPFFFYMCFIIENIGEWGI